MDNLEDYLPQNRDTELVFFVNGKKVIEPCPDPEWMLLWYLRKKLQLTGTKYGCGEGGCGACTVMISQYLKSENRVKHIAVNACLMPLCMLHGLAVTTVEGIGNAQDKLHPVQERIAKSHGSQCGFCTPGIVMSMYALLRNRNKRKIEYDDIESALQGNLCRCTGYRPIVEGFKTFMEAWEGVNNLNEQNNTCAMGQDCCRLKNKDEDKDEVLFSKSKFLPYSSTQEPIFPPELLLNNDKYIKSLLYRGKNVIWLRPQNVQELLLIKMKFPAAKIVVGYTEVGVEVKFKKIIYPILLSPSLIEEMSNICVTDTGVKIGATVTLSDIQEFLQNYVKKNRATAKVLKAILAMLHWFAGTQVRNVASIVGNILTASPISDLNPILMASNSSLIISSLENGTRRAMIDETFFVGYRKVKVADNEVVLAVEIPFTEDIQFFKAYKQAKRRDDDISIVTAAFNVKIDKNTYLVKGAKLCFGGMGPTTLCAKKTSEKLIGYYWNKDLIKTVFDSLNDELQLDISVPGGMADYRKSLCLSLFFKFYIYVSNKINCNGTKTNNNDAGACTISRHVPKSTQYFEIKDNNKNSYNTVGKPVLHVSAIKQATGEAIYCDDIPILKEELFMCLILSTEAHARITSLDASKALLDPDVVAFFSAADLPKNLNKMGPIIKDEEIFATDIVTSQSCIIGAIVAKSESAARKAKCLVKVTYEKLNPVIVTIEDAIMHNSFYVGFRSHLEKGNVNEVFVESNNIKEGYIRTGAQEHFYLETISAFAMRKEEEMEIICSCQSPAQVSASVANVLGIPIHKVVTKVKRIGGGFGGKETKGSVLAIPTALAAYKLKKPVRAVLERDEDIQVTGYRHPFLIKYKVAYNNDGKILGAIIDMYVNVGYSMDMSYLMLERALFHADNCYYIPNVQINGHLCKTNLPSNTAFRGFGSPKGMLAAEALIRDVANALGKAYEEIAAINLYQEGNLTHFNQKLTYCTLSRCWQECIDSSNYWERKKNVDEYNRMNRWKKKGLSIVPTKYGISFGTDTLMQGGALILIYRDGSILLSIGGVEMGQGLFTKMIQVASRALNVDISKIHVNEMATDKVPNSSPTAASVSSDLYGMAVLNACKTLNERLEHYKTRNPEGKWENWISAAYVDRVCLSATGFYSAPKIEYDVKKNYGNLYEYFTYGVACSEVIIDCLTGDHQVLRTDIVMDVGESLNPAIDIGQVEGGFMQGYGFCTMEEMLFSPNGEVLTKGPGTYKIPGISDIPQEFNVSLLKGAPNPRAVYSSKAVGEPPFFLAVSVFFAIKEAITSARIDAGHDSNFTLNLPATCARIRMACEDHITEQVKPTIKTGGKLWNVVV